MFGYPQHLYEQQQNSLFADPGDFYQQDLFEQQITSELSSIRDDSLERTQLQFGIVLEDCEC